MFYWLTEFDANCRALNHKKIAASLLGLAMLFSGQVGAVEISLINPITFGSIDLHPSGDAITINASAGSAFPVSSGSVVTGGHSGQIIITSQDVEHVNITYPVNINLTSGSNTITLINIGANSQYSGGTYTLEGGVPLPINIGGSLVIPAGQTQGSYSGQMTVTLNFS